MTTGEHETVDILMITYNRPRYTRQALAHLLESCDEHAKVWIWQNGSDPETLAIAEEFAEHPAVGNFHHSLVNEKLTVPTNWLWKNSEARFLSKVDDDCLVATDWLDKLRTAHRDRPEFGIIGTWRFEEEDFDPVLSAPKLQQFGDHELFRNLWVEGSGYLMKRECLEKVGPLVDGEPFTAWCIRVAREGWINGWLYPFLYQEHMDDPRAEHTGLKTDEEFMKFRPLTAVNRGVTTVDGWTDFLKRDAYYVQKAPLSLAYWSPRRARLRHIRRRLLRQPT